MPWRFTVARHHGALPWRFTMTLYPGAVIRNGHSNRIAKQPKDAARHDNGGLRRTPKTASPAQPAVILGRRPWPAGQCGSNDRFE